MGDAEARRDFPRQDVRAAFCHSTFRRARGNDLSSHEGFFAQAEFDGPVREETLRGRTHLVAPATMLRETVLEGWDAFVPWSEISRTINEHTWEGRPIVLAHPTKHGEWISAGHLDTAERWIGAVHNVRDGGDHRMRAEVWIDTELAGRFERGAQLMEQIRAGEQIEVSTGYLSTARPRPGEFNGRRYSKVHEHLIPDHFAIGVGRGQCSVADGCGINNEEAQMSGETEKLGVFMATMQAVGAALGYKSESASSTGKDGTDGKSGNLDAKGNGAPSVIVNVHAPQEGEPMADDRERLIKALVECEDCELTEEQLKGSSIEVLRALSGSSSDGAGDEKGKEKGKGEEKERELKAAAEKKAADEKAAEEKAAAEKKAAEGEPWQPSEKTVAALEALGKIGAEGLLAIAEVASTVQKTAAEEKDEILKALIANERCTITEAVLKAYDLEALRGLDQAYNPIAASFAARGLPRTIEPASGDGYEYPGVLLKAPKPADKKN